MPQNSTGTIDWNFDQLHDITAPLTNVERVALNQAMCGVNVERSKTILKACLTARDRLNAFIAELESDIELASMPNSQDD